MADITTMPVMTAADAASIGFARFNDVPTLPVDIPDGNFTISAKTSDGRRITFFFGEYARGAPPSFVDIQYHDSGTTIENANGGRSRCTSRQEDFRMTRSRTLAKSSSSLRLAIASARGRPPLHHWSCHVSPSLAPPPIQSPARAPEGTR